MQKIAYIDAQNVYLGIKALGYQIDRQTFFIFLQKQYKVTEVKYFT